MGSVVNATPRSLCPRVRLGNHCIGGWVDLRPVWTGTENLAFPGIPSPLASRYTDCAVPARDGLDFLFVLDIKWMPNLEGGGWRGAFCCTY
jgi:hypothetical protein